MGYAKKLWKQRLSEYPTRRRLVHTDGSAEIVDVERREGTVSQEGDAFSEENMNDLENRIAKAFEEAFDHEHEGEYIRPHAIDFMGSASAKHGGFQDFHFLGDFSVDFTTRLIELAAGVLSIQNSSGTHTLLVFSTVAQSEMDNITQTGLYRLTGTPGLLIHLQWDANYAVQIYHSQSNNALSCRQKRDGKWSGEKQLCSFA